MLQVGSQALGLERRPHRELQHAVRLARPDRELVRVQRELLLHRVDDVLVLEEEDLFVLMVSFMLFFVYLFLSSLFFHLCIYFCLGDKVKKGRYYGERGKALR